MISAGTPVNVGPLVSRTITAKLSVAVLPAASVAEQVTGVEPSANFVPEAGVQLTTTFGVTASVADVVKLTVAPSAAVASAITSSGAVIAGAVVSCTVTENVLVELFPASSCAVQVTVVAPSAKVEPDAGAQAMVGSVSTASDAVGLV